MGEQQIANTTKARVLRHAIDPNVSDVRSEPRNLAVEHLADESALRERVASLAKTVIVEALCRVPTWRRQDQIARLVRRPWSGFRDA